jgi:hypothetical protein
MNRLLEPETPATERRRGPRFWQDEEKQSVIVGLILTFILWWPSLLLFGWSIGHIHGKYEVRFTGLTHGRQFNIELAPQAFKQPPPPTPDRFVETNPDAPANIPDKTQNFAARNQQAAQEKPTPNGHNDLAATTGRKDIQSTQIVDGHLNQEKPVPPEPTPATSTAAQATPSREQNPLNGFDKSVGENKDAFGTNVGQVAENMKDVPKKIEGSKDAPLIENPTANTLQIDAKRPMKRPQLADHNTRPAIFSENPDGASNVGLIANAAFRTNYGEYLDRMQDAVQAGWDDLLNNSGALPPSSTSVVVTFILKSDGTVSQIVKVEGNSSDLGQKYCVSAITDRGSYGKWSDDMIKMMGTEQQMTFTFYYQ